MKKNMALFLIICLCIMPLSGCTQQDDQVEVDQITDSINTRVIVDQAGNEVEIPNTIDRVVISSLWPLPSVYVLFQGSADKLVGMHPASLSAAKHSMLTTVAPEIENVETSFIQNGEINIEELLNLNPDIVFYNAGNVKEKEILDKAGIPAVGFSTTIADYNTVETTNSWVELLGDVFQEENKAAEITEYGRETYAEIQERVKDIPEEERERVLILFKYSDTQFQTSGSHFFGQFWCEATGTINVASELKGISDVNMEQIYEWNPDIIYVTNFSEYMPEDLFGNTALDGHDWSQVKAVQEGKVYKYPLGMYRWYPPSSDSPLALWFQAKTSYPELFEDIDLEETVKDYYQQFYHIDLTDDEVEKIFNPVKEAAEGV